MLGPLIPRTAWLLERPWSKKHHPGSTSAEKLQDSQPVVNASAEAVPYSCVPLSVCLLKTLPFPFISQGSCAQVVFA